MNKVEFNDNINKIESDSKTITNNIIAADDTLKSILDRLSEVDIPEDITSRSKEDIVDCIEQLVVAFKIIKPNIDYINSIIEDSKRMLIHHCSDIDSIYPLIKKK